MTVITYEVSGRKTATGVDWIAYRNFKNNTTNVFYEMDAILSKHQDKTFEEIKGIIDLAYKHKESKSDCNIYGLRDSGCIDICRPNKTLPTIWVVKNKEDES